MRIMPCSKVTIGLGRVRSPHRLNFSQEQVVYFLGHSLRSLYDDIVAVDMPEHLKRLALKLEEKYPP